MSRLSEAGRLYLRDLFVLEAARADLETFLRREFWEPLQAALPEIEVDVLGPKTNFKKEFLRDGELRIRAPLPPAPQGQGTFLRVLVFDPFHHRSRQRLEGNANADVEICVAMTSTDQKALRSINGGFDHVGQFASVHGLDLDLDSDDLVISRTAIAIDASNMTKTREEVAGHLRSALAFLSDAADWFARNTGR